MSTTGPAYLRWREERPIPREERFEDLDAALDAVEARWDTLKDRAPQVLDHRKILMLSTAELTAMMVEGGQEDDAA